MELFFLKLFIQKLIGTISKTFLEHIIASCGNLYSLKTLSWKKKQKKHCPVKSQRGVFQSL